MGKVSPKIIKISYKLKIARELAGLSQKQVAKIMGLQRPSISEIEAGRRKVSAEELAEFAKIYAVSLNWLVAKSEADESQVRIELAARELSKLKPEDVDRLLNLISALRDKGDK